MSIIDLLKLWKPSATWLCNEVSMSYSTEGITVEIEQVGTGHYRADFFQEEPDVAPAHGHGREPLNAVWQAIMTDQFKAGMRRKMQEMERYSLF